MYVCICINYCLEHFEYFPESHSIEHLRLTSDKAQDDLKINQNEIKELCKILDHVMNLLTLIWKSHIAFSFVFLITF